MSIEVAQKSEQVKLRLSSGLNAEVGRMAGQRTSKSAWIEEAIRQRVAREASGAACTADLPAAARERIEDFTALVRAAVRDVEFTRLEAAWKRDEDPEYYGLHARIPSTLDACVEAMVGRGRQGRVAPAPGCM